MTEPKRKPDWELAERLYRAGQLTLRQAADQVGCTEGAIRKRAKLKGWHRDLTHRVREQVRAAVVRDEVRKVRKVREDEKRTETPTDEEIVEGATAATLLALTGHTHTIGRIKDAARVLMEELAGANEAKDTPLLVRAETLRKIADSASKVIILERESLLGGGVGNGIESFLIGLNES